MRQAGEQETVTPGGGCFHVGQSALALAGGVAAGGAMAWLAAALQSLWSPWLVLPLLTGLVLGAALVGWVRLVQAGHRPTIVAATLLAVAALTVGQHYFSFRAILRATRQKTPEMEKARLLFPAASWENSPLPPQRFGRFLRWQATRGRPIGRLVARGGWAWASWALDGLLLAASALAVVGPAIRRPYCNHCRSWFRATRRGRLEPDRAAEVVRRIGRSPPEPASAADYRLLTCIGGCGPTGLEIRWLGPGHPSLGEKVTASGIATNVPRCDSCAVSDRFWLDAAALSEVLEVLNRTADQ
jgi:hypothetical protein